MTSNLEWYVEMVGLYERALREKAGAEELAYRFGVMDEAYVALNAEERQMAKLVCT